LKLSPLFHQNDSHFPVRSVYADFAHRIDAISWGFLSLFFILFLVGQRAGSVGTTDLSKLGLKDASVQQPPFPCNDPLLFVIPSVPGFPASPLSPATTYVVLPKENHMQLTEAATLDRKSGEAEGSAVRHSCAPLLPAHKLHQSSPNPSWKHQPPLCHSGFQGWSAEPQTRARIATSHAEGNAVRALFRTVAGAIKHVFAVWLRLCPVGTLARRNCRNYFLLHSQCSEHPGKG